MTPFATTAQLAAYLGITEGALPPSASRMLARATELIDAVTRGRYVPAEANATVIDRMVKATCAQVEYWIGAGEASDIEGGAQSYRAGSVSVTRARGAAGAGSSHSSRLAPRARDLIFRAGLLNAGVNVRATIGFEDDDQ